MKETENEGTEDSWKQREPELSAESASRKTRHHRKIALSRTHLFSIPSPWSFAPCPSLDPRRAFLRHGPAPLPRSPPANAARKSVSQVPFVPRADAVTYRLHLLLSARDPAPLLCETGDREGIPRDADPYILFAGTDRYLAPPSPGPASATPLVRSVRCRSSNCVLGSSPHARSR